MKTLNLYVAKSFTFTFFVAIGVLSFGLMGARMIPIFKFLARGGSPTDAFLAITYILPWALAFAIPWAILVSVILVFGRLSADHEITAMRACGVSIMQVIAPIIVIVFAMTVICLYLQLDVGYHLLGKARKIFKQSIISNPLSALEPGKECRFDDIMLYFSERVGRNNIRDIDIYVTKNGKLLRNVNAKSGVINADKQRRIMAIKLFDAVVAEYNPQTHSTQRFFTKEIEFTVPYGAKADRKSIADDEKFLSRKDLFGRIVLRKEQLLLAHSKWQIANIKKKLTKLIVELNKRVALALSPIAFLLLGLPLAIRTSRRETSAGLFLSVILGAIYYFSVVLAEALHSKPELHPELILWIPCVLYQIFGIIFIYRIAKR